MWKVVTLSLILVCGLSAKELYWDDDRDDGVPYYYVTTAVLFHDAEGDDQPGDTDGQLGVISEFKVSFNYFDTGSPPDLYIYSWDGYGPDDCLWGPLDYTYEKIGNWYYLTLDETLEVTREFYAVVSVGSTSSIYSDTTFNDWDYNHSRYREGGQWWECYRDFRIRVEWTPLCPAVDEASWGWIKASSQSKP